MGPVFIEKNYPVNSKQKEQKLENMFLLFENNKTQSQESG